MSATGSRRQTPHELTDAIIDLLHDDVPTLCKCALAARALNPRARIHLFKRVCVNLRRDSEQRWKELYSMLHGTAYVRELEIVGECLERAPLLRLDTLGITPGAFPDLIELKLHDVTLPSPGELVQAVLSLPNLQTLLGDHTTYADVVPAESSRWYSQPLPDPPAERSRRPSLKTLHLTNSTPTINGTLAAPAADILTCLMDASLHVALEVLILTEDLVRPLMPAWIPLVQACAPNLHTLTLSISADYAREVQPGIFDALRALPCLRALELGYEAFAEESWLIPPPLVPGFLVGILTLVRREPVPFPALESLTLIYHCANFIHGLVQVCYPDDAEPALHAILGALLATHAGVGGGQEHRYPCLRHFAFRRPMGYCPEGHTAQLARLEGEYSEWLAMLEKDLKRIAEGTAVEVEASVSPLH